jgi:hypothetical protein
MISEEQTGQKIINHFGLSSGKDSTALWGWAFNEEASAK